MSRRLIASLLSLTCFAGGRALAQTPDTSASAPAATPAPTTAPEATPAPATNSAPAETPAAPSTPAPDSAKASPTPQTEAQAPKGFHLTAGNAQDAFFLRSDDDNFILIPSGRLQMDFYGYQGAGLDRQKYNQFTIKRARLEAFGTFMKHFDFQLGAELTSGTGPITTDNFVNINYTPYANVQIGQFDAPFTMENRTSDKYTDMQERARAVAAFAIPENKELGAMVWGQPTGKWAYWSAGLFNGEGQNSFTHISNHFDFMGRAWVAPGGAAGIDMIKNVWVGGSYYNGFRGNTPANEDFKGQSQSAANQVQRRSMTDTAGVTLWNGGANVGEYGQRTAYAFELNAPVGPVVVKGEFIHMDEGLRELGTVGTSTTLAPVRTSKISGNAYYARVSYFFWGDSLINGQAGMQNPPHLFGELKNTKTADALQLVLQLDHIGFDYTADDGADQTKDKLVGTYNVNIYGVGLNYWATKHVRLTGNFLYNDFSGNGYAKDDGTVRTAAGAPPLSGTSSYEVTFRVALAI